MHVQEAGLYGYLHTEFKSLLVKRIDQCCESDLNILKYHLADHLLEDFETFWTFAAGSDSSS